MVSSQKIPVELKKKLGKGVTVCYEHDV
jgi:hypothetical protein